MSPCIQRVGVALWFINWFLLVSEWSHTGIGAPVGCQLIEMQDKVNEIAVWFTTVKSRLEIKVRLLFRFVDRVHWLYIAVAHQICVSCLWVSSCLWLDL